MFARNVRMGRRSGAAVLFAVLLVAAAAPAVAQSWRVDPARTRIAFSIDATGWPTTRGQFGRFDGRISLDLDQPARSSVRFVVQAGSVDVGSKGLSDYVRSSVFFDAERHPTLTFTSTAVSRLDARTAKVTGNLTMLGVTRPVELTVKVDLDRGKPRRGGNAVGLVAEGMIRRSEFGMNSGIPLIDDRVRLTVSTEAVASP